MHNYNTYRAPNRSFDKHLLNNNSEAMIVSNHNAPTDAATDYKIGSSSQIKYPDKNGSAFKTFA